MDKKNIVLVIDDLGIGGAEMLLIGILSDLNENYNVILVTLTDKNHYGNKAFVCASKYILGFKGKFSFLKCITGLRKIIKRHQPVLVQSHLFYSNFITRMACPASIPCLYTIHSLMSNDIFKSTLWKKLEKQTIRKNHSIIAVSKDVLKNYQHTITGTKRAFVLENYVRDVFVVPPHKSLPVNNNPQHLKLIAVGNIKKVKNYQSLVQSFLQLKAYNISLDIYGLMQDVPLWAPLQTIIDTHKLPIRYNGMLDNIEQELVKYDLYVMPSLSEGFGIAAIEAMAKGLPLLLSDITVLKNVTHNNGLFFDSKNPEAFAELIKGIMDGKYDLKHLSLNGMAIVQNNYTKDIYLKKLYAIYDAVLNSNEKENGEGNFRTHSSI